MAFITQTETHSTGFGIEGFILSIKTAFSNWIDAVEKSRTASVQREVAALYPHIKLDQNADRYTK